MKKAIFIVALILSLPMAMIADDVIGMNFTKKSPTQWVMDVTLTNSTPYSGFQIDFVLPNGVSADVSSLTKTTRLNNLTTQANTLSSANLRVTGYAATKGRTTVGSTGNIFSVTLNADTPLPVGTYEVKAKNVRFSTDSQEYLLAGATATFEVSESATYNLKFWDGDKEFYSTTLAEGSTIPTVDNPTKEGYDFAGWGEVPSTMPGNDLNLYAQWTAHKYTLSYLVDGVVVHTEQVAFGSTLPEFEPEATYGHSFCGWSDAPETMPSNDLSINARMCPIQYTLNYMVEGKVVRTVQVPYGSPIPNFEPEAPEGYSFCGWTDAPESMPANELSINARMCINYYNIYYFVDGDTVHVEKVAYNSPLPEYEPKPKAGYDFAGWDDAPETMPAADMDLEALWTIRKYNVKYYIDGELVHTQSVAYGEEFELYTPEAPTGYVFRSWLGDTYDTMPAHDILYEALLGLKGDVNLDGKINSADVVCIYNYIISAENSGIIKENADVNGDKVVNSTDVTSVYNLIFFGAK